MAALASPELVNLTINDVDIQVPKGELIVESVKRLGLEIPIFCYHPRMKPVGMCRMCLVEVGFKQPDGSVRRMPKPQAGCTLPASEGMVVYTDTEAVHRDRKGVLEFLLINHPLDCPICDRGGECPLQNNTLFYGPSTSRYVELKRHLPKAFPLSQYVTLDLERCIQCGRCVRFTEEISGDAQLAFRFRGAQMQPSTYQMTDFDSKFSGNVIEICPVGALTSAKYRFRARPWDLETREAICTGCGNGCNLWIDHRNGRFVRANGRTNDAVNEEWTCDRGKFGHDWYNSDDRLSVPLIRRGERFEQATWAEAYELIIQNFRHGANKVGALVGGTVSNEGLFLLQKLFRQSFESNNLDYRWTRTALNADRRRSQFAPTPIAELEVKSAILVFGTSLADEQPIVHLRVRKASTQFGVKIVVAHSRETEMDRFADVALRYRPGTELSLAQGLAGTIDPERCEVLTGVPAATLKHVLGILDGSSSVLTSRSLLDLPNAEQTLDSLEACAKRFGADFSCYALGSNDYGADLLGVVPDALPGGKPLSGEGGLGTSAVLEAAARMRLKALWLVEADPFALHSDSTLVTRALENVEFLVVQSTRMSEATQFASVVLPMEAPAEQDGTYTNIEGRVQRMRQVLKDDGDAKQAWRVYGELLQRTTNHRPYFNAGEVMAEIAELVPEFKDATYDKLEGEGQRVVKPTTTSDMAEVN